MKDIKKEKMIIEYLIAILILFTSVQQYSCTKETDNVDEYIIIEKEENVNTQDTMKIKIIIGENILMASLNNSETTKDFVSMLPLTITLNDYANTEKVSDLDGELSTEGAPAGYNPEVGDITYYAPWGNLAIFYNDFGYANGLIKLGKIEGDISILKSSKQLEVKIEVIE